MNITKKLAAAGVAGVLSVTGLAVVAAPLASAATATEEGAQSTTIGDRLQAIRDALAGLVTDGTITQEQADQVATTLDESDALRGHGGHGGHHRGGGGLHLDAAAEVLGITTEELRTALSVEGTTLADVAAAEGMETATLVDALVAEGTERIDEAVTDGRITQEHADEGIAALPERVAALIDQEPRFRRGPGHGHGPRGGDLPDDEATPQEGTTEDGTTEGDTTADDARLDV